MPPRDAAEKKTGERRHRPRYQRRLPVRFGTEAHMSGGSVVDVSESGIRIEAAETFPVNSVIHVFIQFPRHSVRLRARVAWSGGGEGSTPAMGLTLTQPEPTLARAYKEWQAEIKLISREEPQDGAAAAPGASAPAASPDAAPAAAAAPAPEPAGPVQRRLESPQGLTYDVRFERRPGGWELRVAQNPPPFAGACDLQATFRTYAEAEKALREFVRKH
jgi:hypothetical protein